MKQLILNIPENKFSFFLELINDIKYVKIENTIDIKNEEIVSGIRKGLQEVQLIEQGKMNSTPLIDFLNEI